MKRTKKINGHKLKMPQGYFKKYVRTLTMMRMESRWMKMGKSE